MKKLVFIFVSVLFVIVECLSQCSTYQLTTSQQNVSCTGLNDGSISITNILGGTPPYTYYWGGPNGFVSNEESVDNLSFGVYSIIVEDVNGCFSVQSIVNISQPFFNVQTSSSDVSCYNGNNGSGSINVIGGELPINYAWTSLGLNSSSANDLSAGAYPVLVTDNNGCQIFDTITINQPLEITIDIDNIDDVSCFGGSDGEISVVVSGGTGNYSYLWTGDNNYLNSSNVNTISNLLSQNYNLKVSDQQNCETSQSIFVGQSADIVINSDIENISCHGFNDGTIDINVTGGNAPFNYSWSNGENASSISNLSEDNYTITVTDVLNCQKQSSLNIIEPLPLTTELTTQNISCKNLQDGSIALNVSGGTGNYYPLWNDSINLFNLDSLSSGTYNLLVSDDNDCYTNDSVLIIEPDELSFQVEIVMNPSCYSYNDGMILCSSDGGTGMITYNWSDDPINSNQRINLLAGQYTVTVSDANGCQLSDTILLDEPEEINFEVTINDHLCFGDSSAAIFIDTIYGGNGNFSILWSNLSNSDSLTNLFIDTISLNVFDQFNCFKQETFTFSQPDSITIDLNQNNVSCSGQSDGSIDAFVSGGTGAYNLNWSTGDTLFSISNLSEGNYFLTVTDNNNCTYIENAYISSPLPLSTIVTNQTSVSCPGGNDGKITLNSIGGTAPYTYIWSNGLLGSVQDSLSSGNYIIETIDNNNCLDIDVITMDEPNEFIIDVIVVPPICFGDNNGEIQLTIQGGTPPYQHYWSNNTFNSNLVSFAGAYSDSIVDFNSCHIVINDSIPHADQIELNFDIQDVSCVGLNDGSVNLSIDGGSSPYLINWELGETVNFIDSLFAGTYIVNVIDSDNCSREDSVIISEPNNGIFISSLVNQLQCYGDSSGSIEISVSGGNPPYSYLWSTGDTVANIDSLAFGIYTLNVSDANACSEFFQTNIFSPNPLDIVLEKENVSCFGFNDGSANLIMQGGTPPYYFNWSNNDSLSFVNNLSPGEYSFIIYDNNNCSYSDNFLITEPDDIQISLQATDITCFGENNGTINSSVTGGNGFFDYLWSNGAISSSISNLSQGVYSLVVSDNKGCNKTDSSLIIEPEDLSIVLNTSHVNCFGQNNGSINVFISGGTGNYTSQWNDSIPLLNLTNLVAGDYHLTVSDENNCFVSDSSVILEPELLTLQVDSFKSPSCFLQNDGHIFCSSQGGTGAVTYNWNDVEINSFQRLNLLAGEYIVTIVDENTCQVSDTILLVEPLEIEFEVTINNHLCYGDSSAAIFIDTIYGGNGNYSILWSNESITDSLTNLFLDTISLIVTDQFNCSKQETYTFTQPDSISINFITSDISCSGQNDGSIDAIINGGIGSYELNWSNGDSLASIVNLSEGNYLLSVKDSNDCLKSEQTSLFSPDQIEVIIQKETVSCYGLEDGSASVLVQGGTPPYSINWSTGDSTTIINNLSAGEYFVTITDDNSCSYFETFFITEPDDIQISLITNDISCFGAMDGSISSVVTGGNGFFEYSWSNSEDTSTIDNLNQGVYALEVNDSQGCSKSAFGLINEPAKLSITLNVNHASCFGQNDGSIDAFLSGGTGNYNVLWNDSINLQNLNSLYAGNYHLVVTDENNCTATDSAFIEEPDILILHVDSFKTPSCFSENDGMIFCSSQGGSGSIIYNWTDVVSNSAQRFNLSAGNYIVTINDENNCQISDTIVLDQPSEIDIEVSISNHLCFGDSAATIFIDTILGGNGNYSILWSNSSTSYSLTNLFLDSISLIVTDQFNCSKLETYNFVQPDSISISYNVSNITCAGNDGSITAIIDGGVGDYNLDWSTGDSIFTITNLSEGSYSLTVLDSNNCSLTEQLTLNYPDQIDVIISKQEVSCYSFSDGSASLIIQDGTPTYSISWSTGDSSDVINNLSAGEYSVVVTDANNCTYSETFIISEPDDLQISLFTNDISCFGLNDGSINSAVSGGNEPYSFLWSDNSILSTIENVNQGIYTLNIEDSNGCTKSAFGVINEPDELIVSSNVNHVECFGESSGSIDLIVSGGTGAYSYLWSDNSIDEDINNITSALYTVTVSDENGCTVLHSDSVFQPETPLAINDSVEHINCSGQTNGSIQINTIGGTAPYSYIWSNGDNSSTLNNLSAGLYSLLVLDNNGCVFNYSTTILSPSPLSILDSVINESCIGSLDGQIFVNITGGSPPYNYLWDNGFNDSFISNLSSSMYNIQIEDSAGCILSSDIFVDANDAFDISYEQINVSCFNQSNGSINITISGGSPPFSFLWSDGSINEFRDDLMAGNYSVTITDGFGCIKSQSYTLTQPDSIIINANIQDATCSTTNDGSIETSIIGGTTPYEYLWSNSESSSSLIDIFNGGYSLQLTDANGCLITQTFDVDEKGDCLKIPNVFTPNGDGDNDFWVIQNIDEYSTISLQVVNDSGIPVYTSTSKEPWDGSVNGKKVDAGVYFYIIMLDNVNVFTGPISIIR